MTDNKFVRTSSGVWKQLDVSSNRTPSGTTPVRGTPTSSQTAPPVMRTPPGGLPAAPRDRGAALAEQARADLARGNLASAETNFRLALTFAPGSRQLAEELKAVVEARDAVRRASGPLIR